MNRCWLVRKDRRWGRIVNLSLCWFIAAMSGCDQTNTSDGNVGQVSSEVGGSVHAQGRIVPTGGIASVVGLASDRVESLEPCAVEGGPAVKGLLLGYFSSNKLQKLEQDLLVAKLGQLQQDTEQRAKTNDDGPTDVEPNDVEPNGDVSELSAKKSQVDLLELVYRVADDQHQRLVRLDERSGIISQQQTAQSQLQVDQAMAEWKAAEMQYKSMIKQGLVQLELVQEKLALSELRSPIEGTILKIYSRAGEIVGNRPVIQIANLKEMSCRAEIDESTFHLVHPGQVAEITTTAGGDAGVLKGKVASKGKIITAPELKKLDPFAPVDSRVVEVSIVIDAGFVKEAAKLINRQVDVEIFTEDHSE